MTDVSISFSPVTEPVFQYSLIDIVIATGERAPNILAKSLVYFNEFHLPLFLK